MEKPMVKITFEEDAELHIIIPIHGGTNLVDILNSIDEYKECIKRDIVNEVINKLKRNEADVLDDLDKDFLS